MTNWNALNKIEGLNKAVESINAEYQQIPKMDYICDLNKSMTRAVIRSYNKLIKFGFEDLIDLFSPHSNNSNPVNEMSDMYNLDVDADLLGFQENLKKCNIVHAKFLNINTEGFTPVVYYGAGEYDMLRLEEVISVVEDYHRNTKINHNIKVGDQFLYIGRDKYIPGPGNYNMPLKTSKSHIVSKVYDSGCVLKYTGGGRNFNESIDKLLDKSSYKNV